MSANPLRRTEPTAVPLPGVRAVGGFETEWPLEEPGVDVPVPPVPVEEVDVPPVLVGVPELLPEFEVVPAPVDVVEPPIDVGPVTPIEPEVVVPLEPPLPVEGAAACSAYTWSTGWPIAPNPGRD